MFQVAFGRNFRASTHHRRDLTKFINHVSMTNEQKKDLAQLLYTRGIVTHQGELALRVDVTEDTISKWKKAGSWDDMKKSLLTTRQEELRNLYDQLSELNAAIKQKPEGERYADSKQADIQRKITASIRELETETSVAQVVDVFIGFSEFIRKQADLDTAKQVSDLQDAYIKKLL